MSPLVLLLVASQARSSWNQRDGVLEGRTGAHRFRVEIACQNFEPRGRKIGWKKDGSNYFPSIDDRRTWGFDGNGARERKDPVAFLRTRPTEVRTFKVRVDGRVWRAPASLTFDLLNLDLGDDHGKGSLSKDGRKLVLVLDGSDGGGGYGVRLTLGAKGPVERRVYIESEVAEVRRAR